MVMLKGWTTGRLLSWLKWSEGRTKSFVAQRYEPLLRFDSTPVYDVTLAEDVVATSASPYSFPVNIFDDKFQEFLIYIHTEPATSNSNCRFRIGFSNSKTMDRGINSVVGAEARHSIVRFINDKGVFFVIGGGASGIATLSFQPADPFFLGEARITSLALFLLSSPYTFPAGTTITIYAAKEAE